MPTDTEPIENPLTHHHGYLGCYLQPGVDPTAMPIALPPGFFGGPVPSVGIASFAGPQQLAPRGILLPSLLAYLAVAVAYFAIGVAVGALARRLRHVRTPVLTALIVPGVVAGLGFLAWVVYSSI